MCPYSYFIKKSRYWRITKDEYDKKLESLKDRQYQLNIELGEHTKADHKYHIHVSTVINLSRRMKEIFESSEIAEKRTITNLLLQNPTVSNKKLLVELKKPFDTVLQLANCPTKLPIVDKFRTLDWTSIKAEVASFV